MKLQREVGERLQSLTLEDLHLAGTWTSCRMVGTALRVGGLNQGQAGEVGVIGHSKLKEQHGQRLRGHAWVWPPGEPPVLVFGWNICFEVGSLRS